MTRAALLIAATLIPAASAASADSMPHRVAIDRLPLTVDLVDAAACVTRSWGRVGHAKQYQTADGIGVDWSIGGGNLFMPADGSPQVTIEFHREAAGQFARVVYRHPFSQGAAVNGVRGQAKNCFPDDWNRWAAANGGKPIR